MRGRRLEQIASLFVKLDHHSEVPLQQQIYLGLRDGITSGVLKPDARLPSTRALAEQLGVSRTTITHALLQLVEEGYLATRERSGIFVRELDQRAPAAGRPATESALHLSRRGEEAAREAIARESLRVRPRAFRLSRPALDQFPVREWSRILSKRAAKVSIAQLDYGMESPELQSMIAELTSSSRGMRVRREQVLLFSGSQRALEFAARAVLDPGDRAWMEEPGYPGARNVLLSVGASLAFVPVDEEGLVVDAGESTAPDAKLVFTTPSVQFPTGVIMSLARRQRLLGWAARAGACILEDDYDCEFRYAGAPLPALFGLDESGRVLYVNSFSRTMFPAIRLGYLIAPDALVDRLRAIRATFEEELPSLTQLALADFIGEGHFVRHLNRMKVLYRERRNALLDAARAVGVDRLRVHESEAGLHALVDLPPSIDAIAVSAAAAKRGVEAPPLADYCANGRDVRRSLVLGFGAVEPARARESMEKLAAAIDEVRSLTLEAS